MLDLADGVDDPFAVPVGGVHDDGVHACIDKGRDPFVGVGRDANGGGHAQTAILVFAGVGEFTQLDDVAVRDEAHKLSSAVHHGQLFNPVLAQNLLCLGQVAAILRHDEVFAGHQFRNGSGALLFKTKIAVRHDAHEHAGVVRHGNATDFVLAHDGQRVSRRSVFAQGHGILDHAALRALHLANFIGLRRDAHVFVHHADAAVPCHGDGHAALRHGVHGGTHDGGFQLDVSGERRMELHVPREHF